MNKEEAREFIKYLFSLKKNNIDDYSCGFNMALNIIILRLMRTYNLLQEEDYDY